LGSFCTVQVTVQRTSGELTWLDWDTGAYVYGVCLPVSVGFGGDGGSAYDQQGRLRLMG